MVTVRGYLTTQEMFAIYRRVGEVCFWRMHRNQDRNAHTLPIMCTDKYKEAKDLKIQTAIVNIWQMHGDGAEGISI